MSAETYDVGDSARLSAAFRAATITYASGVPSSTLALADPTTITLELTTPAGTTTSYAVGTGVTKSSTGVYYRDVTWTEAGEWRAKWTGTGAVAQTDSAVYTVQDQGAGP